MASIAIREVGLRDGLQMVTPFLPTEHKISWIKNEHRAGVREIEVTSLVPPQLIPQFADAAEVIQQSRALDGLVVAVLIPNLRGAQRGLDVGVDKLNFVMSASESHNLANVRRSTAESLEDLKQIIELVKARPADCRPKVVAGISTAFGCTIEGRVDQNRVIGFAVEAVAMGADELTVADTVGYANPAQVRNLFKELFSAVGDVPVAAHFHDTRGLGLANALAAADVGIRIFDASMGGLGGCPHAPGATGNVNTEDLVFLFESMGMSTGIDLDALFALREQIHSQLPDEPLSGSLAKAGLPKGFALQ